MQAKRVKAELQTFEVGITKALNGMLAGESAETRFQREEPVIGETINITGIRFQGEDEGYPSIEEYINDSVNDNMLCWSKKDGNCCTTDKRLFYDPAKWFFFWFNYDQEIEEPSHVAAYNPETQKLDILFISYSVPETWCVEKSTWLTI